MIADPYATLGLPQDAPEEDVKQAYRKLAMQYHPDRNPGNKVAEEKFKEVNNANDLIKNGWHPGMQNAAGNGQPQWHTASGNDSFFHQFNDIGGGGFADIFAAFHAQNARRNRDVHAECPITLEDAFKGKEVTVNINHTGEARTIKVQIPAGVDTGTRVRVPQAGDKTYAAFTPGDLYINIHIIPHARFKRVGPHLITTIDASVFDVMLGAKLTVIGIDGREVALTIPPGFKPEQQLRVHGYGMPASSNATQHGDLLVSLNIVYPTLTQEQTDLMTKVRDLSKKSG